jgi:hypothetical protein
MNELSDKDSQRNKGTDSKESLYERIAKEGNFFDKYYFQRNKGMYSKESLYERIMKEEDCAINFNEFKDNAIDDTFNVNCMHPEFEGVVSIPGEELISQNTTSVDRFLRCLVETIHLKYLIREIEKYNQYTSRLEEYLTKLEKRESFARNDFIKALNRFQQTNIEYEDWLKEEQKK